MPVESIESDPVALTITVVAEYTAPIERLWAAWADPRSIERFWGPQGWSCRFTRHDMVPGGRSAFSMTRPDGATSHGWWEFAAVDPGRMFEVRDGFANPDGTKRPGLPEMTVRVMFEETAAGARFTVLTTFPSAPVMEEAVAMGLLEGYGDSLAGLDDVLAST